MTAIVNAANTKLRVGAGAALLLPFLWACSPGAGAEHPVDAQALGPTIRGASVEPPRRPIAPDAWDELASTGVDWVAVIPYVWVDGDTGDLLRRPERTWDDGPGGVRGQVAEARRLGLKVLLKPHLWVRGAGGWAGEYLPGSDEAWLRWEAGYRAYLLQAAAIAEELDLEMLAVGTELTLLVEARPAFFRELIGEIREVYGGPLTYAANWDAYDRTPLWDLLDYIGIDAYFPLVEDPGADVDALVAAWRPVVAELEALSARHTRLVLFTEWGYRSVSGAAGPHWLLPSERRAGATARDERIQAAAYEAFFRTWWDRPWVAGGFFWNWHLAPASAAGGRGATPGTGFDPRGKEAEEVIRRWYGAASSAAARPGAPVRLNPARP